MLVEIGSASGLVEQLRAAGLQIRRTGGGVSRGGLDVRACPRRDEDRPENFPALFQNEPRRAIRVSKWNQKVGIPKVELAKQATS